MGIVRLASTNANTANLIPPAQLHSQIGPCADAIRIERQVNFALQRPPEYITKKPHVPDADASAMHFSCDVDAISRCCIGATQILPGEVLSKVGYNLLCQKYNRLYLIDFISRSKTDCSEEAVGIVGKIKYDRFICTILR